jgi:hypothetical protein
MELFSLTKKILKMDKQKGSWFDVFSSSTKNGRSLVQTYMLARAVIAIIATLSVLTVISYALGITNMVFTTTNFFASPSASDVVLTPSSSPSCVGDYTLTVGSTSIDCLGTSPTRVVCDNGYDGIIFDGSLLCPINQITIPPGPQCALGGVMLFYQNTNQTFNVTTCISNGNQSSTFNLTDASPIGVSVIQSTTLSGAELRPLVGTGSAVVTANGSFISIYVAPSTPSSYTINETLSVGESLFAVLGPTFTTFKKMASSSSVFFSSSADEIQAAINFVVQDALTNGTSWIYYTDGLMLEIKQLFVSGALTLTDVGGGIYLTIDPALVGHTITSTPDGIPLFNFNNASTTQFLSLVDTSSIVFNATSSNISANAILTLQSTNSNGIALFSGTSGNTGTFKTLRSDVPGLTLNDTSGSIVFNWATICSDGRPSILFNGTAICGWQYSINGSTTADCSVGFILFSWSGGSTSWCLPGPATYSPANPLLFPNNTRTVPPALDYLGLYRSYTGLCPTAGQEMICGFDGSATDCICATRIDSGVASAACPGGTYVFDSGIGVPSAEVCLPHVWDGAEVTVDTLVSSLSLACGGVTDVTAVFNCIWNDYILPGLTNTTSASVIVYTPPFRVFCQDNFTISAMLTKLIIGQLPSNTFNIYVNPVSGNDTCGGGTFANPWASIAYAITKIVPSLVNRFYNIILSVNTHVVTGDLYLPPNVQFTTIGSLRYTTINVTGNIYLNSSWSLYANEKVYSGFSGITLYYNQMVIDFRTIGSYGPSSDARFQAFNSEFFGNGIWVYGRGSTDLLHLENIDFINVLSSNTLTVNCAKTHQENSVFLNCNSIITDENCTTPVVQTFFNEIHTNTFLGSASLSVSQITSDIEIEHHTNGYDDGSLTALGTIQDALHIDTTLLPLNIYYNSKVKFSIRVSTKSIAQANLSSLYWPCTECTADVMFLALQDYAKYLNASNFFTITRTATTNSLDWTAGVTSNNSALLTGDFSGGNLNLYPVDSVGNSISNGITCFTHGGSPVCNVLYYTFGPTADCPTGGILMQTYNGNFSACFPYNSNITTSAIQFTTDNFIQINNTAANNFTVSFIGSLVSSNPSFLSIVKNANGSFTLTINTPVLTGDSFIQVIPSGINNQLNFTATITSNNTNLIQVVKDSSLGNFALNVIDPTSNSVGTNGRNCLSHGGQTVCDTFFYLSAATSNCPSGVINIVTIQGNFSACVPFASSSGTVTILNGTGILILQNPGTNNFTISNTGVLSTTAGTNIVQTGSAANPILSTSTTPTFASGTFSDTSNQLTFGTTNTITMNVVAPTTSRTITWPDPGAAASVLYNVLAQTITGLKTLGSDIGIAFSNAGNTFSTTLKAASGLASSFTLRLPGTLGNANDVLTGDAAGNLAFSLPSVKTLFSNTASLTQANPGAAVFVTMFPTGTVSLSIPANTLIAGSKIHFKFFGTVSTNAGSTFSFRGRLDGATTYGTSSSSTAVALNTIPFNCQGFLTIITAGAGGTALTSGFFFAFTSTTNAVAGMTSTTTVAIDTTASHTFDVQFAFSASNAANTITILGATMEHMKPYA